MTCITGKQASLWIDNIAFLISNTEDNYQAAEKIMDYLEGEDAFEVDWDEESI